MLLLTLSLFTPLCSLCKDSVHRDHIQGKRTPIHLLPNGIASSRGEGWHSPCQGDGEVLLLIIAVGGGNNLSRHQARQLPIKVPLFFSTFGYYSPCSLCASLSSISSPLLHSVHTPEISGSNLHPGEPHGEHNGHDALTRIGQGTDEDKHLLQM